MLQRLLKKITGREQPFRLPDGHVVYAVGDIHGRAELLVRLCEMIEEDFRQQSCETASLVFLGDYVDRGYQSREVIDYLIRLHIPGIEKICLAGNHEDMLLDFLTTPEEGGLWLQVGGAAALASYGVMISNMNDPDDMKQAADQLKKAMPDEHLAFLTSLKEEYRIGDYVFVHAGLRPGVPLEVQRRQDKLCIRHEFTEMEYDFGVRVVHGHTGVRKPLVTRNRVAIDTGAFATGVLTAMVAKGSRLKFLQT